MVLAGLAFCILGAHPFVGYPLSLWLFAGKVKTRAPVGDPAAVRPTVAICMSAYNEEAVIEAKMESLIAMARDYGPATIHVYADAPADRTVEILQRYENDVDLVVSTERSGKTHGMNTLVARSSSELIMFTDANVVNDTGALSRLVAPFEDAKVGCTSAQLVYSNNTESPTSATGAFYWSVEERIKQIESETVGMIGVDGAMFVMRRSLHVPPPPYLIDDLFLSLTVLIRGFRVITVEEVEVFERSAIRSGEEYERKKRIACQAMNVHRALWPQIRRMPLLPFYAYLSHRLFKWLMPFFLLGAALCFWGAFAMVVGAAPAAIVAVAAIALVWAGDRLGLRPFPFIATALLSLIGVGTGIVQSLTTSRTYTVWNPALSVRQELS